MKNEMPNMNGVVSTINNIDNHVIINQALVNDRVARAMANLSGCSLVGITTETDVTLKGGKKNLLQGRVTKRMDCGNVFVFCNITKNGYEEMVLRRMREEGIPASEFKLGKLPWGERVTDTPFIYNKGVLYMQVIFRNPPKSIKYFVDGVETPKEDIEGLDTKKEEGFQGGLSADNKVIVRTYKTKSIKGLRYQGTEYKFA